MKKILSTLLLSSICAMPSMAQLSGNGYYRVQNAIQGRYVTVIDDRGSVNLQTNDADMAALRTVAGFERVASDPGSIIYIKSMSEGYDLQAQGTGSYKIISYQVKITDLQDGTYWCSATSHGMTKYLADELIPNRASEYTRIYGSLVTNSNSTRDWWIKPVTADGDNYFGITPEVEANGTYYSTFCASFPFSFASEGMEAYTVSAIDEAKGAVVIKTVSGTVAAATPVIVKCASEDVAGNRLNIGPGAPVLGSKPIKSEGNLLTGVYFCNPDAGPKHTNVVENNPKTMRVLGTSLLGQLAFIKVAAEELPYIPKNSAYITVSEDAPDVLYVVDENNKKYTDVTGDLNGDGIVNAADADILAAILAGEQEIDITADLNNDGMVDNADAELLNDMIVAAGIQGIAADKDGEFLTRRGWKPPPSQQQLSHGKGVYIVNGKKVVR